uniref:Uncharacterized protein n=1 Tax=Glossina austeni TaxID=7395 RepID=A0A1A9UDD0_GLOAU
MLLHYMTRSRHHIVRQKYRLWNREHALSASLWLLPFLFDGLVELVEFLGMSLVRSLEVRLWGMLPLSSAASSKGSNILENISLKLFKICMPVFMKCRSKNWVIVSKGMVGIAGAEDAPCSPVELVALAYPYMVLLQLLYFKAKSYKK